MIELDAQAIRNLQSLGYVAGTKVSDDFEFDQTKEDPKDLIEFHNVYRRATGLVHKKQYEQVKEICKKLLADRPNFHELHDLMADIALTQKQYAQALPYLYQGLKLKPGRYKVHHNLAVALGKLGKSEESVEQFKKVIELAPNDTQTRNKIALELLRQKQVSLAITQFESSLNLDPNQPHTLNTMARIFATTSDKNLRDPKKAIELAKRACELTNFKQPATLYTLSIACASAGQFQQAISNAQKALSLANMAKQNTLAMKIKKHLQSLEAVKQ
jgi:tetratricopeptide (TPR) repeat protein